jgi:histidinol-phosphatase (PHP family)
VSAEASPPFGRWDGHCHTAFSRRDGLDDSMAFVQRAAELGFARVSLTEHPTFPAGRIPEELRREVYLDEAGLERYVTEAERMRDLFGAHLEVRIGFEIDYVAGDPRYPLRYLERYAGRASDGTLSVHFLPTAGGGLAAIDVDPGQLEADLVVPMGGIDAVRRLYWETVEEAMEGAALWGLGFPRRLSHLDVIGKFRDRFPLADPEADRRRALRVLERARALGFALDVNAKGVDLPLRHEAYPERALLEAAHAMAIPLVYGSDAHGSDEVGRHRDALVATVAALGGRQDVGPTAP